MNLRLFAFFVALLCLEAFAEAPPTDRSLDAFIRYYNGLSGPNKRKLLTEGFDLPLYERRYAHLDPEELRKLNEKLRDAARGDASELRAGISGGMDFTFNSLQLLSNVDRLLFNLAYLRWSQNYESYYQTTLSECESDLNLVQQHIDLSAASPLLRNNLKVVASNSEHELNYPITSLKVRAFEGNCMNRDYAYWAEQEENSSLACATIHETGDAPCPTDESQARSFNQSPACQNARKAFRCLSRLSSRLTGIGHPGPMLESPPNESVNSNERSGVKDTPANSTSSRQSQGSTRN